MNESLQTSCLQKFITQEKLPQEFYHTAKNYYLPLATTLIKLSQQRVTQSQASLILGINGAQGTGKSTLAALLTVLLRNEGLRTVTLSIDDLYLPKVEREELAQTIHPLLQTRGVPGTHDTQLGCELLNQLNLPPELRSHDDLFIPRFDKSLDDRLALGEPLPEYIPDIILLEGWCVGAQAQNDADLDSPCNSLEQLEDPDANWRRYVNNKLKNDYQELFLKIDYLVMLKAPDFDSVFRWRNEQEEKLREQASTASDSSAIMSSEQIKRFIMFYERLTHWMLDELPKRADITFILNQDHQIIEQLIPDHD